MFDPLPDPHAAARFWLDVADKAIKAAAVLVGAAWTWINVRRSRTYATKLELQLSGAAFVRNDRIYVEIIPGLRNIGASRHEVQQEGTICELYTIQVNGDESLVSVFPVFATERWIEPGESIGDLLHYSLENSGQIVWLRLNVRVVSHQVEWNAKRLLRITGY